MNSSKIDQMVGFQREALNLRTARQQVLAANIANADTPHYKARDFDFGTALADAMGGRKESSMALAKTQRGHLDGTARSIFPTLMYRGEFQSAVDGNTVDMDVERTAFSDNAIRYEASINFISGQLKGLQTAISGQ